MIHDLRFMIPAPEGRGSPNKIGRQNLRIKLKNIIWRFMDIAIFLVTPGMSLAQGQSQSFPPRRGGGGVPLTNPLEGIADDFLGLVDFILKQARLYAGMIAVLVIIYGAYQILFAAGDPTQFKAGRQTIIYAVIGFALVLLAGVITDIIRQITGS